jgi:hypothetical protein
MSPARYELGCYTPEDGILHSHSRHNLKSYLISPRFEVGAWEVVTPTLFFPLERANINHLRMTTDAVFETSCFVVFRIPDEEQCLETR